MKIQTLGTATALAAFFACGSALAQAAGSIVV